MHSDGTPLSVPSGFGTIDARTTVSPAGIYNCNAINDAMIHAKKVHCSSDGTLMTSFDAVVLSMHIICIQLLGYIPTHTFETPLFSTVQYVCDHT